MEREGLVRYLYDGGVQEDQARQGKEGGGGGSEGRGCTHFKDHDVGACNFAGGDWPQAARARR